MDSRPIHDIDPTPLEVGFSDEVLILISLVGFTFLFAALACLCHFSPSQAKFDENNGGGANGDADNEDSYDRLLEDADVSTLNRAQRKARAKLLIKKKKRAGTEQRRGGLLAAVANEEENNNDDDNNNNNINNGDGIVNGEAAMVREEDIQFKENNNPNNKRSTRKERQKAAKEEERLYRREYEEIRKLKVKEVKDRKEDKEIRLRVKKELMEIERQEALDEELKSWTYFFDDVTVNDFVEELRSTQMIDLKDTAHRFSVSMQQVIDRLDNLEQDGRINHGIIDKEREKYYFITDGDMETISSFIKDAKALSTEEMINMVSEIIVAKTTQHSDEKDDESKKVVASI